ncbi:MAG TPA: glycosyltransferase family A protein [Salinivirgaceae bacterium]|nr:glycosyltransferase family A protein [Salinivirgaceae bacterium]
MSNLVSVIIPNYNHARFLQQRIESVLNQTYRNIEVIILDDCSTDNSREIIEKYQNSDNRIRTIYNKTNYGSPFKQWKKGIDNAKGELIWIAESDDYSETNFLTELIAFFDKNSSIGLAYCLSAFVDEQGKVFGNHSKNLRELDPTLWETDFVISGKIILSRYLAIINVIPNASAALFKKSIVETVNWTELFKYRLAGDRYFWAQILSKCQMAYSAKPMNYFRFTTKTVRATMSTDLKYMSEIIDVYSEISRKARIPIKTRISAVRQWLRHAKKVVKAQKSANVKSYLKLSGLFIRLIFRTLI